jgi:hypothetical protein
MDETTKLTIRLPREQVEFLKSFAAAHDLTATEVITRGMPVGTQKAPGSGISV